MWPNRLGMVLLAACLSLNAQDTAGVGSIAGIIVDAAGTPLGNVGVCLAGEDRCDATDVAGAFAFRDLRVGFYSLELTPPGRSPYLGATVEVRAGLTDSVEIALPTVEAAAETVTVVASVFIPPEEVKTSGVLVSRREVYRTAGALQDVSRYVQTLPGVAGGSADFRNDIIVRGGSPLENLFIVDNIEIPNINNFANFASAGGTASLVDVQLIEDATFLTGGYPAPFVNRLSSVLQIAQREGARDGFRGRATVAFAGAGAVLEGPINRGKGSWIVSARRSYLDAFTDDIGIGGIPRFWSFTSKAVYDLSPRDRIWAVNITGLDDIRLGLTEERDFTEDVSELDINYNGWRSVTGLNWQRLFGSKGVGLLGISHSEASVESQVKDLVRNGVPSPDIPVDDIIAAGPVVFREDSQEGETTIKYDLTIYSDSMGKIQAGANQKIFRLDYNVASPLGYDGPFTVAPDINPIDLSEQFYAYQSSAYLQTSKNLTNRLNVTLGGRFDYYEALSETRFSPRAGVSYRITDQLSWRASFGSYFQQPFFLFYAAFPENRDLVPSRADHYVTGFSYTPNSKLRMTAEVYRKNYKDYPVSTQFPSLSFANIGDTFDVRDILFPMTGAGRGRSQGVELFVEKKFTNKWFGQANLSFSQARHAGLDEIRRPGAFDYPAILNIVGGYRLNPKWEFGVRSSYLRGRPFTPFNQELSTEQRRGVFDLKQVNQLRAPDFYRLDIRVDRTFTVRDKPLILFVGIQNVTGRNNFGGINWDRRLNQQDFQDSLKTVPIIGLDWSF